MKLPTQGDSLLGKYLLEMPLGEGGMGIVYSARHVLLGQRVAVKFLLPQIASNTEAVARFLNEARAAARIESDHVARVLDVGLLDDALPYMVLEFLDGDDLSVVIDKRGQLPVAEMADHLLQAIEALAHAHVLGIVHRDLKPSNLFLARRPDGSARVKVLDFGISKMMGTSSESSSNITKTHAMLGSPLYMSPEQLRDSKSVDHRCDIWALGVIAYELLTGHPPFTGDNAVALFAAIHESEPARLGARRTDLAIPDALEDVVRRCLQRNPNERFASVTELGAALVPFATEQGARAFENARRILPTAPAAAIGHPPASIPNVPSTPNVTVREGAGARGPAAYAHTANPWTTSGPTPVAPPRKNAAIIGAIVFGALALVGIVAGAIALRHPRGATTEPVAAAAVSAAPPPSVALPVASVAPIALIASVVPVAPSSAAIATPSPIARPRSAPVTPPVAPPAPSAPAPPAAPPARNCDPPYTINSAGHHVLKPECQ